MLVKGGADFWPAVLDCAPNAVKPGRPPPGREVGCKPHSCARSRGPARAGMACASRKHVAVYVYTIVDGDVDPLFALLATPFGVPGIFLTTVRVGGREYFFDGSTGAPAAEGPSVPTADAPAADASARTSSEAIRWRRARRPSPDLRPPDGMLGAAAVSGFKGVERMGAVWLSTTKLESVVDDLRSEFTGANFDLARRNPNHFSDALCARLVYKPLPDYILAASVRAAGHAQGQYASSARGHLSHPPPAPSSLGPCLVRSRLRNVLLPFAASRCGPRLRRGRHHHRRCLRRLRRGPGPGSHQRIPWPASCPRSAEARPGHRRRPSATGQGQGH